MKKEEFFELIGDIDETAISAAETPPAKSARWRIWPAIAAAACLAVAVGAVFMFAGKDSTEIPKDTPQQEGYDYSNADIAIESDDVKIFYLDEDKIVSTTEYLACDPKDIFTSWKAHNGIGDEVELIKVRIEDNGTDSVDDKTATHTVGDYFILNVTVSEGLKSYYSSLPEDKLLESLRLTMTGYGFIDFNEYHLIFE